MILLEAPFTAPTATVSLKNPELGDLEVYKFRPKVHTTIDGSVYAYRNTLLTRRLELQFNKLSALDKTDLVVFAHTYAGQDVKFTDWLGRIWKGRLLNETLEFVQTKNFFQVKLEFDGKFQGQAEFAGSSPQVAMSATGSVS
jgi:hypothetical protein